MNKYRIPLKDITAVAASKTVTIRPPIGYRYHGIFLQHGYASGTNTVAGACANITEIRIFVNGKAQRTISGTYLRDMLLLMGTAYDVTGAPNTAPGVTIPIHFNEPFRDSPSARDSLAWATAWSGKDANGAQLVDANGAPIAPGSWDNFYIEIDLSGATTPTLIAFAVIDSLVPGKPTAICKWKRVPIAAGSTDFEFTLFDKRDFMQQISLYPDSGGTNAATEVLFKLNGETLHDLTSSQNLALLTSYGMVPDYAGSARTAHIYDLVFDHDDLLNSAINMAGIDGAVLEVKAGGTMSGTITAIIQRLGLPE